MKIVMSFLMLITIRNANAISNDNSSENDSGSNDVSPTARNDDDMMHGILWMIIVITITDIHGGDDTNIDHDEAMMIGITIWVVLTKASTRVADGLTAPIIRRTSRETAS